MTTKGFRDVLNMRRGLKARQFDKYAPPPALVPRHRIQVVEERITLDGAVMTPLSEDDVRAAARALREEQVDAVAVSCLWSFRNPAHEQRIGEILQEELPDAYVSLSTEVLPQIRVYERHSTTALNAYVGPVLKRYLVRLEEELATRGFGGTLLIMQSNGGVMSPALAQRFASNTLLSGPAAARWPGFTTAAENAITVDMGGTSFDVALVSDGVRRSRPRARSAATASPRRSSTSTRSAPAAARSPGSTAAGCWRSAPRARAPTPDRRATAAAASSRR